MLGAPRSEDCLRDGIANAFVASPEGKLRLGGTLIALASSPLSFDLPLRGVMLRRGGIAIAAEFFGEAKSDDPRRGGIANPALPASALAGMFVGTFPGLRGARGALELFFTSLSSRVAGGTLRDGAAGLESASFEARR